MLPFSLLFALVPIPPHSQTVTDPLSGVPVTIAVSAFEISATEVTQQEYEAVMGANPSARRGPKRPVENVTWFDAIRYCNRRSEREKLTPCYDLKTGEWDRACTGYRLPTDAEWTRAAGKIPGKDDLRTFAHLGGADTKDAAAHAAAVRASGPRDVASLAPNEAGLYDVYGNVWEWIYDRHDPLRAVHRAADPAGPGVGVARVLRGGSFASLVNSWTRGFVSSLEPERRTPYTGFRVCRGVPNGGDPANGIDWKARALTPPPSIGDSTGPLSPLRTEGLREKWEKILGAMTGPAPAPHARLLSTTEEAAYTSRLMQLQVERDFWEKMLILTPRGAGGKLPVVIVPYYDVDTPAGRNLGGRNYLPYGTRAFAHLAAIHGFMAVTIRWFGESYAEHSGEGVADLTTRHPNATGLGKWVWDARRLLDYLYTLPEVDRARIGIIGHSLGGKMALYAAAMDPRITAVVSSELGIGLSYSNYDDFWYLGKRIAELPPGTDHHELLALIAPRPFLLIAGESADADRSWHYLNAVRPLYAKAGRAQAVGSFNHRTGHSPTPESVWIAMEWLRRWLR